MRETKKIWMNGELVDWADATVHIGTHGLHYGSGVFEGIRAYETERGTSVFRLTDHLERLHRSAQLLYIDLPYSVEELKTAAWDVIGANELPSCYLRPIAFVGYGELGVSSVGNPIDVAIMSWPWGAYLGEEGQRTGSAPRSRAGSASARTSSRTSRKRPASTSTRCWPWARRTAPATTRRSC
jgi:branched-chain amino acid aminotransferase